MAGGFEGEGGSRQREVRGECSPRAWAVRGGQLGLAMVSKSGKQVPQSGNKSPKTASSLPHLSLYEACPGTAGRGHLGLPERFWSTHLPLLLLCGRGRRHGGHI